MRRLLEIPSMTMSMTDCLALVAQQAAPPDTECVAPTADQGFPYIAYRPEAQIDGAIAFEMMAREAKKTDAAIIAAFGGPGLAAAREFFDFLVLGMAQAALTTAAMLGERLSIVTFSPVMRRWCDDSVRDAGRLDRFTGVRTPDRHTGDVVSVPNVLREELVALCTQAVEFDDADVIIPGGAPLASLAGEIAVREDDPIVDPIAAAMVQAVALDTRAGLSRWHNKPLAMGSVGLDASLLHLFAHDAPLTKQAGRTGSRSASSSLETV